jgi:hypothetical protein
LFWFTPSNSAFSCYSISFGEKTDSCCTLGEELELLAYEQFLLALRRQWLKHLHLYLASSDFSTLQNLKGQQGIQKSKQNYCYQNINIWEVKAMSPFQLLTHWNTQPAVKRLSHRCFAVNSSILSVDGMTCLIPYESRRIDLSHITHLHCIDF